MLRDGPCSGSAWTSHQHHFEAPFPDVIQVVKDRVSGDVDVLDLADDAPQLTEDVFPYRISREQRPFHVCDRSKGAGSGWFVWADYEASA
jgi:hypothetical protein